MKNLKLSLAALLMVAGLSTLDAKGYTISATSKTVKNAKITQGTAKQVSQYYQTLLKGNKNFIKAIPTIIFPEFSLAQIKGIPAKKFRRLKKSQLKSLTLEQVQALSTAQLKKLKPKKLDVIKSKLSATQKAAL